MIKKTFSPARILYLLASLFFYFLKSPSSDVPKYSEKHFKIIIPKSIADIKNNSFIIIDISNRYDFSLLIRKCMKYGNIAFLKIDTLERANIFTQLGLKKLRGIFYYKNDQEIYDVFQQKRHNRLETSSVWLRNWDVLILSRIVEFKAILNNIGISRRILEAGFRFILQNLL